jgi:peptide deformylase
MAILEILHYPHPILKKKTQLIQKIDPAVRQLIDDMAETMYAAPGVGLAAPQVGHPVRLAVLDVTPANQTKNLVVLINPEIVVTEGECLWEEGCLSVPGFNATVARPEFAVVRGLDLKGNERTVEGKDLLARAFQHEMDHLDGRVFLDRLRGIMRPCLI